MVVKFEIDAIDNDLLSKKQTTIEDLQTQKDKLEKEVTQIASQFKLTLSSEQSL